MKKLSNTLYITTQDTYLHKEQDTIVVRSKDAKLAQFPIISISGLYCFGQVTVSHPLMSFCAEKGVGISYFNEFGRFFARVHGKENGNVLLRRAQYRWADEIERKALPIAKLMVAAKIANSRTVLQRQIRNHGDNEFISAVIVKLADSLRRVEAANNISILMGIEGEAAQNYFSVFQQLLLNPQFSFSGRVRRPPTDPVNALLSFTYSLLVHESTSALQGVGLDPYVGFLHQDRPGRVSLALDLLEEFRAAIGDRLVLSVLNRREIGPADFITEESGAVSLTDGARKRFLRSYQEKKQEEITHPFLDEKIPIGLLPHCQAMLLARHIRGDLKCYTPYILR